MGRAGINRTGEMEIFVRVVEEGGFSQAARQSRMTPSAVSKLISRLELRLDARLLNRSTRQLQLTPEGCVFYERAQRILQDLDDAERCAGAGEAPAGRLRLSTSASYATHVLMPVLPEFLTANPGVSLTVLQSDTVVDLLAERIDVAVRAGQLADSTLVARKLGQTGFSIVAAPGYLERFGTPAQLADLDTHVLLDLDYVRAVDGWAIQPGAGARALPNAGRVLASDGEALRQLALAGVGIARMTNFTVRQDIADGRLVSILHALNPADVEAFHAVYLGQGGPQPTRVRAFLDFLAIRGQVR